VPGSTEREAMGATMAPPQPGQAVAHRVAVVRMSAEAVRLEEAAGGSEATSRHPELRPRSSHHAAPPLFGIAREGRIMSVGADQSALDYLRDGGPMAENRRRPLFFSRAELPCPTLPMLRIEKRGVPKKKKERPVHRSLFLAFWAPNWTTKLDHQNLTLWALWDSNPGPTDYESAALTD
jgi:hypothetical protein